MENIKTFEGFWDFLKDKNPIKKTLHYQELYSLKKKIRKQCEELNIKNYTINNDGTVDVNGNLSIYITRDKVKVNESTKILINFNKIHGNADIVVVWHKRGRGGVTELPFTFNEVGGNFSANGCQLESLRGCPKKVGGFFAVIRNNLTTLEHSPTTVGGNFLANESHLTSLKGAPEYVGGNFDISDNNLTTLEYLPKRIDGTLSFNDNKITSLDYYNDCKITMDDIRDNPIYLIFKILKIKRGISSNSDLSDIIDTFKSYDPIHPRGKMDPVLYLDRLELFLSDVLGKDVDIKNEIERIHLDHLDYRLAYRNSSIRFLLEDYYSIKY